MQQFAQLSAVLAPWYNSSRATDATDVGTYADEFQLSGVFLNSELKAARLAFAAVGVTADTAGLQIKQHWLARNCPKGDAESIVNTLLDWGWSAIPLQRFVNKVGDRCQWRLGSEVPPPASRMYLKDQTVVFEPLEFQASVVGCLKRGFSSGSTSTGVACPAEADCPADCASFAKHSRSGQRRPQAVRGPGAGGPGPEARSRDDSSQAGGVAGKL